MQIMFNYPHQKLNIFIYRVEVQINSDLVNAPKEIFGPAQLYKFEAKRKYKILEESRGEGGQFKFN